MDIHSPNTTKPPTKAELLLAETRALVAARNARRQARTTTPSSSSTIPNTIDPALANFPPPSAATGNPFAFKPNVQTNATTSAQQKTSVHSGALVNNIAAPAGFPQNSGPFSQLNATHGAPPTIAFSAGPSPMVPGLSNNNDNAATLAANMSATVGTPALGNTIAGPKVPEAASHQGPSISGTSTTAVPASQQIPTPSDTILAQVESLIDEAMATTNISLEKKENYIAVSALYINHLEMEKNAALGKVEKLDGDLKLALADAEKHHADAKSYKVDFDRVQKDYDNMQDKSKNLEIAQARIEELEDQYQQEHSKRRKCHEEILGWGSALRTSRLDYSRLERDQIDTFDEKTEATRRAREAEKQSAMRQQTINGLREDIKQLRSSKDKESDAKYARLAEISVKNLQGRLAAQKELDDLKASLRERKMILNQALQQLTIAASFLFVMLLGLMFDALDAFPQLFYPCVGSLFAFTKAGFSMLTSGIIASPSVIAAGFSTFSPYIRRFLHLILYRLWLLLLTVLSFLEHLETSLRKSLCNAYREVGNFSTKTYRTFFPPKSNEGTQSASPKWLFSILLIMHSLSIGLEIYMHFTNPTTMGLSSAAATTHLPVWTNPLEQAVLNYTFQCPGFGPVHGTPEDCLLTYEPNRALVGMSHISMDPILEEDRKRNARLVAEIQGETTGKTNKYVTPVRVGLVVLVAAWALKTMF